jgi:hypothetical protein
MTAAYTRSVREGADAELRGDAATALRLHRSVPMFRQSTHGDRLQLLAELGADAPRWLVNRWLTIQARRRVWTRGDENGTNRVLQLVVPLIYPDAIQIERIGCAYVEQVMPYIYERDWVVRQVDVYDLGGLRRLAELHATPELLERTEHLDDWLTAPMRACRIERVAKTTGDAAAVVDLTTSEEVELLNRGLGVELAAGQHVLGRIVPTGEEPGAMFEWRPLAIDRATAQAVAANPRRWLPTLAARASSGQLEPGFSHLSETSLTAELPRHAWMSLLGTELDAGPDLDPTQVVEDAARQALALASDGVAAVEPHRHVISELLLDVSFTEQVRGRLATPDRLPSWQALAEVVPLPARNRCLEMAMWCDASSQPPDLIA